VKVCGVVRVFDDKAIVLSPTSRWTSLCRSFC